MESAGRSGSEAEADAVESRGSTDRSDDFDLVDCIGQGDFPGEPGTMFRTSLSCFARALVRKPCKPCKAWAERRGGTGRQWSYAAIDACAMPRTSRAMAAKQSPAPILHSFPHDIFVGTMGSMADYGAGVSAGRASHGWQILDVPDMPDMPDMGGPLGGHRPWCPLLAHVRSAFVAPRPIHYIREAGRHTRAETPVRSR